MERRLARGLDALLGKAPESVRSVSVEEIDVTKIVTNPQQPRLEFEPEALNELASSIESHGLIQPIVVQRLEDGFELIAGERRLRAVRQLGRKTIPAIIRSTNEQDRLLVALVENLQRRDLNPIEEALAFERLQHEHRLTHEQIAQRVGRNRSTVTNTLRLLELPQRVRDAVSRGTLSAGHARALLPIAQSSEVGPLVDRIMSESLSVRETEALVRGDVKGPKPPPAVEGRDSRVSPEPADAEREAVERDIESRLRSHWGVMVKARWGSSGGEIVFRTTTSAELDYLIRRLEQAAWPQNLGSDGLSDLEFGNE